jgi:hypothetical protein
LVRLSFLFFFFFSLRHNSNGGSYRLHTYTNENLKHHAFVYWDMPDLHEIARWLDERNDVGRKKFDNVKEKQNTI